MKLKLNEEPLLADKMKAFSNGDLKKKISVSLYSQVHDESTKGNQFMQAIYSKFRPLCKSHKSADEAGRIEGKLSDIKFLQTNGIIT